VILPGRLASSTLGDVLGALHRAGVTGVIELREVSGVPGRRHAISLVQGMVTDVETPIPASDLNARLDALFALRDASIRFSVARGPRRAPELGPSEFLHGRPRARDRAHRETLPPPPVPTPVPPEPEEASAARSVLGVGAAARADDIRRAFRRLAREHHPDLLGARPEEAEQARRRLAAITAAYHALTRGD
jgi:DnaJ-domain-containing protein 1